MAYADVDSDTSSSSSSSSDNELDALTVQLLLLSATGQQLWYTLHVYKQDYPELFHSYVQIWPAVFDVLVTKLQDHPIFHNNSDNKQIPIEFQVAVTLYRLGHFGNAVSLTKVVLWASWGFGTVDLCTKCSFRKMVMKWPSDDEKEQAKQLISTPDLQIINYGMSLPGSQHDATAWKETCILQEHTSLLGQAPCLSEHGLTLHIPSRGGVWCMPPYKK
ncbi:hypothetical protein K439DRAFT_1645003 [Ramaria rubella]|nr:hypothetical protein K439DRAFT_1645003 [Ramaria rubella]